MLQYIYGILKDGSLSSSDVAYELVLLAVPSSDHSSALSGQWVLGVTRPGDPMVIVLLPHIL